MNRLLLLSIVGALSGCFFPVDLGDRPCESEADCVDDFTCIAGMCVESQSCESDDECAGELVRRRRRG